MNASAGGARSQGLTCLGPLLSVSGEILHPLQKEFFQDDVFPDTAVTWEPILSAKAWFEGANGQPRLLSLQPPGMTPGRVRNKTGRQQGKRSGQGWKEEQRPKYSPSFLLP